MLKTLAFAGLMLAAPAAAQDFLFANIVGPASGTSQAYAVTLTGAVAQGFAITAAGDFQLLYFDEFLGFVSGNEYATFADCASAPCSTNQLFGDVALTGNRLTFTAMTPASFNSCAISPVLGCSAEIWRSNAIEVLLIADVGGGTLTVAAVPEPATWALMIAGFGLVGVALRRTQRSVTA